MAQFRQSGLDRAFVNGGSSSNDISSLDHVGVGVKSLTAIRQPRHHHRRSRVGGSRISIATLVSFLCFVLAGSSLFFLFLSSKYPSDIDKSIVHEDDFKSGLLPNMTTFTTSEVRFGNDKRRDEYFSEEVSHRSNTSRSKSTMKVSNDKNKGSLKMENKDHDIDDEYDSGIDSGDAHVDAYDDSPHENEVDFDRPKSNSQVDGDNDVKGHATNDILIGGSSQNSSSNSHSEDKKAIAVNAVDGQPMVNSRKKSKKRHKHKFSSSNCEMKLLNSTELVVEPLEGKKFARFSLSYTEREMKPNGVDNYEPRFAGHQSLRDREDSFIARDQKINCGFVNGHVGLSGSGFDLDEDDVRYISKCHIAVISCIFGNSDRLRSPFSKLVSHSSRKSVCFVMFMDKQTLQALSKEGHIPDRMGFFGLWRVVVVKNLPYSDMRRVGKIPKLLSHRLFPSARYSIWLDSKLRLQRDPLLLLEYLLWRKGYEYAISNHYDRHCVWEEVERNKKLNKFNHTMIDQQFAFYQADGLKRFNASDPNKMLPSNVPEGSLIVRAHTPMSNLFSCLWFNEVDRFTPRDQLSFAYTYQKLQKKNPSKPFYIHMFKDCERRKIAKLFHHRALQKF